MSGCRSVSALFLVFGSVPIAAQATTVGWPDTIDLLAQERTQAQACVNLLKSSGDKPTITEGQITYGSAKAAADGAIAGFMIALVEGGKPEDLPLIEANLEKAGAGLQEVCDAAAKAARVREGTKGFIDKLVTAAVGPVVDALKSAAAALWTRHVEKDKLEREMIEGQLQAAKWPDFE